MAAVTSAAHVPKPPPTPSPRTRCAGGALLQQVLDALPKHADVRELYIHVWTENDGALRFYRRFGFEVAETIPDYDRAGGLQPPSCHILRRAVNGGR